MHVLLKVWALSLIGGGLVGCGWTPSPVTVHSPGATITWIAEPQAGIQPWLSAITRATTAVDIETYLLTDRTLIAALKAKAAQGVPIRVILAPNPYHDASAVVQERTAFAGSRVQLRWAPPRFVGAYAFDHAKVSVKSYPHSIRRGCTAYSG